MNKPFTCLDDRKSFLGYIITQNYCERNKIFILLRSVQASIVICLYRAFRPLLSMLIAIHKNQGVIDMKKKIAPIILTVLLLAFEFLPLGAALHISGDNHTVQFNSYFNLAPFANGNFAPFVVAVMSVVLLMLCIAYFIKPSKKLKKITFSVACIAMLLSFCPLFYCMQCYTMADCAIAFILFVITMMFVEQSK